MQLSKEDFEKILDQKLNKQTLAIGDQIEELARMTKRGFDDVLDRLDVRDRVEVLEKDMVGIKTALHLS